MEQLVCIMKKFIVIDWGYTRLKLWCVNEEMSLVDEIYYYNCSLAQSQAHYSHHEIMKVSSLVEKFIFKNIDNNVAEIYTCSQMHCLAGQLTNGNYFLSTWNDLSIIHRKTTNVEIKEGVPLLDSMPSNKLIIDKDKFLLRSEFFSQDNLIIKRLSSPLSLILSNIFNTLLPCDEAWWQSTCIDQHIASILGVRISNKHTDILNSKLKLPKNRNCKCVRIHPETGDLQASTFSSLTHNDIVLNLGTGSQLIFNDNRYTANRFFRMWKNKNDRKTTISHIPCGRLLLDYCEVNKIELNELKKVLLKLTCQEIICHKQAFESGILYFPGYCCFQKGYKNYNLLEKNELKHYNKQQILSYWVMQYYSLINLYATRTNEDRNTRIVITGKLGGFAEILKDKLEEMLSPGFNVSLEEVELYESIILYKTLSITLIDS